MSDKWKPLFDEEPSSAHRDQVFDAVSRELAANRETGAVSFWRRLWLPQAAAFAVCAYLGARFSLRKAGGPSVEDELMTMSAEQPEFTAEDLGLLDEMALLDDLEELEQWETI